MGAVVGSSGDPVAFSAGSQVPEVLGPVSRVWVATACVNAKAAASSSGTMSGRVMRTGVILFALNYSNTTHVLLYAGMVTLSVAISVRSSCTVVGAPPSTETFAVWERPV